MSRSEERRDLLFDFAVENPEGFTVEDVIALGMDHSEANRAIRQLRLFLGEYDSINLICDPQGSSERWLYRLVGTLDEMRPWAANRVADTESRLRTMTALLASIVAATDGRSIEGRKARIMERTLRRLGEDLETIEQV